MLSRLQQVLQIFVFWALLRYTLVSAKQVKLTHEEFEARAKQADAEIRFITQDELLHDYLEKGISANENNAADRWRFVFYGASWCKYCKRLSPRWLNLEKGLPKSPDFRNVDIQIGKYDCTQSESFCQDMGAVGYPTLHLYKNGKLIEEYEGDQKTRPMAVWLLQHVRASKDATNTRTDSRDETPSDKRDEL